jgi:hypothetical protein
MCTFAYEVRRSSALAEGRGSRSTSAPAARRRTGRKAIRLQIETRVARAARERAYSAASRRRSLVRASDILRMVLLYASMGSLHRVLAITRNEPRLVLRDTSLGASVYLRPIQPAPGGGNAHQDVKVAGKDPMARRLVTTMLRLATAMVRHLPDRGYASDHPWALRHGVGTDPGPKGV